MKIGIIGAGQLAQMLAMSAYQLGLETLCFTDTKDVPAARISPLFIGSIENPNNLEKFANEADVITFENENIDINLFKRYTNKLNPSLNALKISQDRLFEKHMFEKLSIPCAAFCEIDSIGSFSNVQFPGILKTRRLGYDGKGQVILRSHDDVPDAWESVKQVLSIVEGFVDFEFEVSQVATRNKKGKILFFPLSKNQHKHGILRLSKAPYNDDDLQKQAQLYTQKIMRHLDYVGTLCCEFFVKNGKLLANEIAPRVHNSGHWSIEGTNCSQFEAHLRAICNLHLPETIMVKPSAMINIIGTMPDNKKLLEIEGLHFYDYGKQARNNRKLGHITICSDDELDEKIKQTRV